VGEVRGLGLFLGVEMVEDVDSKQPSERIASYVAARAIELNVQVCCNRRLP
jgi:4-aminobutyrate aminotransferase-like enzyme